MKTLLNQAKSEAYLVSSALNQSHIDPTVLKVALIAYDRLYVGCSLKNVPWDIVDGLQRFLSGESPRKSTHEADRFREIDSAAFTLARLFDSDRRVFDELGQSLQSISDHPDKKVQDFLDYSFRIPMKDGDGTPIFHPDLFAFLAAYFQKIGFDMTDDFSNRHWLVSIVQELFITHYLQNTLSVNPIFTFSDLWVREIVKNGPAMPMQPSGLSNPMIYRRFYDLPTIQDMLVNPHEASESKLSVVLDLTVPKLDEIPFIEIARLKKKDKFKSVVNMVSELWTGRRFSKFDITKLFVDKLWEMGRTLSPSLGENIIGVLGNAPIGIPLNPMGIASAGLSAKKLAKFTREYDWFITLSDLRELSDRQ